MPSFNIHIAIANEYMRYHPNEIKNREDFIKGSIAPDLSSNKYESHYDNYAERHNGLSKFIEQTEIDIDSDYGKGYFLHLIADELFYHKIFREERIIAKKMNTDFYHDWDCLNKPIIEKFKIKEVPEEAAKYFNIILEEKTQFLDFEKVNKFIEQLSKISLKEQEKQIKNNESPII